MAKFTLDGRRENRLEQNVGKFNFDLQDIVVQNLKPVIFSPGDPDAEKVDRYSYLGTPVYSNLEIPAGQYKTNEGETVDFDGIRLDSVIFDINVDKNIIRTPINGRNGTIKQFIAMGDYVIRAVGVIIGQTDASNAGFDVTSTGRVPESELRKLNIILNCPQEIEVISEFLDFFDISTVVLEGATFSQREGYRDSIYFALGMLSDTPIELKQ